MFGLILYDLNILDFVVLCCIARILLSKWDSALKQGGVSTRMSNAAPIMLVYIISQTVTNEKRVLCMDREIWGFLTKVTNSMFIQVYKLDMLMGMPIGVPKL